MESAFSPQVLFQAYLRASFFLGILLSVKCLVQMAFSQYRTPRLVEAIAGLAALVLAIILGLDVLGHGHVQAALAPSFLMLLAIGLGLIFVAAHLGTSLLHLRGRQLVLQPAAWVAVALTLAATAWSSHRYSAGNFEIEMEKAEDFVPFGELKTIREFAAVTDRGRELELYRWVQGGGVTCDTSSSAPPSSYDTSSNCHGWVFTDGQYLLGGEGLEQILEDNGYELCQSPQPGDLIIYRNADGEIIHSGLVKSRFFGCSVIIDSKWGLGGRFLHPPHRQPYGTEYSYYRSSRQGHALAIRPAAPAIRIASR